MTASTRKVTKQELRREIEQLRIVGCQMANIFYNMSQWDDDAKTGRVKGKDEGRPPPTER